MFGCGNGKKVVGVVVVVVVAVAVAAVVVGGGGGGGITLVFWFLLSTFRCFVFGVFAGVVVVLLAAVGLLQVSAADHLLSLLFLWPTNW